MIICVKIRVSDTDDESDWDLQSLGAFIMQHEPHSTQNFRELAISILEPAIATEITQSENPSILRRTDVWETVCPMLDYLLRN